MEPTARLNQVAQRLTQEVANRVAWALFTPEAVMTGGSTRFFDLASLTKALGTSVACALAVSKGHISWESPIGQYLCGTPLQHSALGERSFSQLLSHVSGMPAYLPFYEACESRAAVLETLAGIVPGPAGETVYSDLGYMVLGVLLDPLLERPWTGAVQRFYADLGCGDDVTFRAPDPGSFAENHEGAAYAGAGIVHDENARLLGAGAGHAGLWGTAGGVARLLSGISALSRGQGPEHLRRFAPALKGMFEKREPALRFSQGWDSPSAAGYTSAGTGHETMVLRGHLGFTGTAAWFSPERGVGAVLLTNRVHAGRLQNMSALRELRPLFFSAAWEMLS